MEIAIIKEIDTLYIPFIFINGEDLYPT